MFKKYLVPALLILSASAFAADNQSYIGFTAGQSNWKGDDLDCSSLEDCKSKPVALNVFYGKKINENLAIEGGLITLGKLSAEDSLVTPTTSSNYKAEASKIGVNVDAVGIWPVNNVVSVSARLGALLGSNKFEDGYTIVRNSNGTVLDSESRSKSSSDISLRYGVGVDFNVYKSISVGLSYNVSKFKVDELTTDVAVTGLNFKYGL